MAPIRAQRIPNKIYTEGLILDVINTLVHAMTSEGQKKKSNFHCIFPYCWQL